MTLHEIKLLSAYNSWATNRLFDTLAGMPPDQLMRDMQSSHGSIHGTLVHLVAAEGVWLSRWTGDPSARFPSPDTMPDLDHVRRSWNQTGFETARFLGSLTDKKLQQTFTMTTMKGETFTHVYWQAILHMIDHSTYHRGQVVTLMRQLGATPPATGMIAFFRETAKLPGAQRQ